MLHVAAPDNFKVRRLLGGADNVNWEHHTLDLAAETGHEAIVQAL